MYFTCVSRLCKVVSHYDFIVLSISVMDFQKKLPRGVGGWDKLYPVFTLFLEFG